MSDKKISRIQFRQTFMLTPGTLVYIKNVFFVSTWFIVAWGVRTRSSSLSAAIYILSPFGQTSAARKQGYRGFRVSAGRLWGWNIAPCRPYIIRENRAPCSSHLYSLAIGSAEPSYWWWHVLSEPVIWIIFYRSLITNTSQKVIMKGGYRRRFPVWGSLLLINDG